MADGGAVDGDDLTAVNRATYDRISGRYAANQMLRRPADGRWFPALEDAFLGSMPRRGLIGDLGCGPGLDGARFAEAGFRVVAMDLSIGMVEIARESLGGRVAQADLRALPIDRARLDGIWCSAALLHVPEDGTAHVLQGFRRALKSSGSLALVTASGDGQRLEDVPYADDEQRWFVYRRADRLSRQLREAGFSIRIEDRLASNREWLIVLAGAV